MRGRLLAAAAAFYAPRPEARSAQVLAGARATLAWVQGGQPDAARVEARARVLAAAATLLATRPGADWAAVERVARAWEAFALGAEAGAEPLAGAA